MTTWFTSDTHFGHRNILVYEKASRNFTNTDEMDEALIDIWNSQVRPGDTVFHLGDFSLSVRRAFEVIPRLNGHVHLIAGNHDVCWTDNPRSKMARKAVRSVGEYLDAGFDEVVGSGILHGAHVGPHTVVLSHLPIEGDHTENDRYSTVRPVLGSDEVAAICGHVHSAWTHHGRNINVGVDVRDLRLVPEDVLAAEISEFLQEL